MLSYTQPPTNGPTTDPRLVAKVCNGLDLLRRRGEAEAARGPRGDGLETAGWGSSITRRVVRGVDQDHTDARVEVGRYNIHVNCVCPGFTKTPATTDCLTPDLEERIVRFYPLHKLGVPEDVAKVVTFVASDGASHVTGQTISVSGGYSMV